MPHRRYRHAAEIVDAVDDIGSPYVVAEGENLPPDVAKNMIARFKVGISGSRA